MYVTDTWVVSNLDPRGPDTRNHGYSPSQGDMAEILLDDR